MIISFSSSPTGDIPSISFASSLPSTDIFLINSVPTKKPFLLVQKEIIEDIWFLSSFRMKRNILIADQNIPEDFIIKSKERLIISDKFIFLSPSAKYYFRDKTISFKTSFENILDRFRQLQ